MELQSQSGILTSDEFVMNLTHPYDIDSMLKLLSSEGIRNAFDKLAEIRNIFQQTYTDGFENQSPGIGDNTNKNSFLVFKRNKYVTVATENIALFYINYESSVLMSFDREEYFVNYSLEQIQHLLCRKKFFRLNRQYLISFNAVKEVEHYFARKLLVNLTIPTKEKLLVSKDKVSSFLHWLDNR